VRRLISLSNSSPSSCPVAKSVKFETNPPKTIDINGMEIPDPAAATAAIIRKNVSNLEEYENILFKKS
jgi:ribosomal protein L6P/L9E